MRRVERLVTNKKFTPEQWNQMVQEFLLMQQCMGVMMFGEDVPPQPLTGRGVDPSLHQGDWARHGQYIQGENYKFPDTPAAQKRVDHERSLFAAPLEDLLKKKK